MRCSRTQRRSWPNDAANLSAVGAFGSRPARGIHLSPENEKPIIPPVIEQAPGARDLEGFRTEIRSFIAKAFKGRPLDDEEDIFATGFVNSLFAMELVTFIEGTFGITVDSDDLDFDNFRTIARVAEFVSRKSAAQDRPASAAL